jgi:hypothetical protein
VRIRPHPLVFTAAASRARATGEARRHPTGRQHDGQRARQQQRGGGTVREGEAPHQRQHAEHDAGQVSAMAK